MTAVTSFTPLGLVALAVLLPLAGEYADLRRRWGLSRLGATLAASTVVPSLALGVALALPLAERPVLQWGATIAVTLAAYSLTTAALRPALPEAPRGSA